MKTAGLAKSRAFWETKASENPYWYVSSYGDYSAERDMESFWRSGQMIFDEIRRITGYQPRPSDVAAEIGCGVGRLTRAMAPHVGHVHGFDISSKMLEIAASHKIPNATFHLAEGATLRPLEDHSCDFVLAYCVFQHLPSIEALSSYLSDMKRVAKPGALLVFTTSKRDWRLKIMPILRLRAFLREKFTSKGPKGVYKQEWIGIRPSAKEVKSLAPFELSSSDMGAERLIFWGRA